MQLLKWRHHWYLNTFYEENIDFNCAGAVNNAGIQTRKVIHSIRKSNG
jgi:hypothetical protein